MFSRELVLRPNCLLTRRPLQLYPGPQPFWKWWPCKNAWKGLHHYLYQHGYPITAYTQQPSHIICGKEIPLDRPTGSTLTVVSLQKINNLPPETFQILCDPQDSVAFYSQILDHCIHLAELDYLKD